MRNKRQGKFILIGLLTVLTICLSGIMAYGAEPTPVSLKLDGKMIQLDVAPEIVGSRTLVPARAVFEGAGGKVTWVQEKPSDIKIEHNGKVVNLVIGSKTALVDGVKKTMEVPAQLFPGNRTLIPVRFVAEVLGFGVDWDNGARTVILTSPGIAPPETKPTPPAVALNNMTNLSMQWNGNYHRVTIKGDGDLSNYTPDQLSNPARFFVDLKGFVVKANPDTVTYNDETSVIKTIRASQFDAETTRVVVDLKEMQTPKVSFSADKREMYLDFEKMPFDPMADGKLVVMLDPGHGK
ncbi:MAG: stalk domain-containing protein, partial [Anaerovorax sp.]